MKAALFASTTAVLILVLAGVLFATELDAPGNRAVAPGAPTTTLPRSTTKFYTVETRRLAGYDAPLPGHAVIIHLVDTTRADRDARVVDPDANGNPDDAGGMWLPGEAFVDSANGISVAVLSATSQGFVVTPSPRHHCPSDTSPSGSRPSRS